MFLLVLGLDVLDLLQGQTFEDLIDTPKGEKLAELLNEQIPVHSNKLLGIYLGLELLEIFVQCLSMRELKEIVVLTRDTLHNIQDILLLE